MSQGKNTLNHEASKRTMKLRITMIDWEYPDDGKTPSPEVLDLAEKSHVMILYMSLANGAIVEMKAEADSEEALDVLRGLIQGAGSGVRADLSAQEKAKCWLYEEGYECYTQGVKDPAYFFVNPAPRPEAFEQR